MQDNSKSIVLTTYACHPKRGSEPGHGWGFLLIALKLAANNNLKCICITLPHYVEPIRAEMNVLKLDKFLEIIAVPIPKIFNAPSNGFLLRIGFIYWSMKTRRVIKKMDYSRIKLIHHTNYASEVLPNPLPKRSLGEIRTIIGPLGSTQNLHLSRLLVRDKLDWLILVLDTLKVYISRFLFSFFVAKKAHVVVNSEVIADQIYPKRIKDFKIKDKSLIIYPSLILDEIKHSQEFSFRSKSSFKFIIVSVFNRRKKIDFALEVLANLQFPDFHCDIYGEGPEGDRLKKYAADLGITERISWKGTIDRETLRSLLPTYDAVLHPSVREAASTITGESIIAGVPIVGFEGTGLASTMSLYGLTKYVVSIPKIASKNNLIENYVQKIYETVGTRIAIGNPFSLEVVQAEVSRWYELE